LQVEKDSHGKECRGRREKLFFNCENDGKKRKLNPVEKKCVKEELLPETHFFEV